MKPLPHTRSCFVYGDGNPRGFKLRAETDGRIVQARFAFDRTHVGFRTVVHGGLTATLLDEVMTWACVVQARRFPYCAELNVRYLRPVRPDQPLQVTAEMTANKRGRLFEAQGEIRDLAGLVLSSATGKYLPLTNAESTEMATDFIGDLSWLISPSSDAGSSDRA